MSILLRVFLLFILCASCSNTDPVATITIRETASLDRKLEYVNTKILLTHELSDNQSFVLTNLESQASVSAQHIKSASKEDTFEYEIMFPLEIGANRSENFEVTIEDKNEASIPIALILSKDKLFVENKYYTIHFGIEDDARGGQVNGIALKEFENQFLKRGHIAMHWAPNFSKSDSEGYFNFEDLPLSAENSTEKELYRVVKKRSGTTDSVPEIHLKGKYEFYADQPYFLFESTMTIEKEVELNLLRNDEMTMDSLFTHVAYPKKNGSIVRLKLYDELDILDNNPITDDAEWVAFYNMEKGFGFGSIRIAYDNRNLEGQASPTDKPYTKISRASKNGRYWNRVLSDTIQVFPKGSRYREKNAYLIFGVDAKSPEKELLYFAERLKNPLTVIVEPKN